VVYNSQSCINFFVHHEGEKLLTHQQNIEGKIVKGSTCCYVSRVSNVKLRPAGSFISLVLAHACKGRKYIRYNFKFNAVTAILDCGTTVTLY
jgi:hypothetical protein